MAATPDTGVDITVGISGAGEGVLTACAIRALAAPSGETLVRRRTPTTPSRRRRAGLIKIRTTNDLVTTDKAFFVCTGITDGELVRGVRYTSGGAATESVVQCNVHAAAPDAQGMSDTVLMVNLA